MCTALDSGLEDVDPKQEQESCSVQAGNPNVLRGLGLPRFNHEASTGSLPAQKPTPLPHCSQSGTAPGGLPFLRARRRLRLEGLEQEECGQTRLQAFSTSFSESSAKRLGCFLGSMSRMEP